MDVYPAPPPWFETNVAAFYGRGTPFYRELLKLRNTARDQAEEEPAEERKHCRCCKNEGYHATRTYITCETHEWPPRSYYEKLRIPEAALYAKYAAEAAAWALDKKRSDDKLLALKNEEDRKMEEQRAQLLQNMDTLCRGCASCIQMDYGIVRLTVEQMCERHQEQYWQSMSP